MASEDQQREIVLGNKQLLSIFFVVVAMMGVAFTIGYIIGRNGGSVSAASLNPTRSAPAASTAPDDAPVQTTTPAPVPIPSKQAPAPVAPAPAATPATKPVTHPAQPDSTPLASEAPDNSEPKKISAGGRYLQVAAVKRPDAERIVHILRERHFPALLGESPKEGLLRVLVGPFDTMQNLADSKAKLRAAGFESIVAR